VWTRSQRSDVEMTCMFWESEGDRFIKYARKTCRLAVGRMVQRFVCDLSTKRIQTATLERLESTTRSRPRGLMGRYYSRIVRRRRGVASHFQTPMTFERSVEQGWFFDMSVSLRIFW
jgi:hypothetical protein